MLRLSYVSIMEETVFILKHGIGSQFIHKFQIPSLLSLQCRSKLTWLADLETCICCWRFFKASPRRDNAYSIYITNINPTHEIVSYAKISVYKFLMAPFPTHFIQVANRYTQVRNKHKYKKAHMLEYNSTHVKYKSIQWESTYTYMNTKIN